MSFSTVFSNMVTKSQLDSIMKKVGGYIKAQRSDKKAEMVSHFHAEDGDGSEMTMLLKVEKLLDMMLFGVLRS